MFYCLTYNIVYGSFTMDNKRTNKDYLCGFGSCTPKWMQIFADPKAYLLVFCILGILQGAYFTYFVGIFSTLEKRFAFESKVTGVIMIADNLSPIVTSVLIGYYGTHAHRPRIIAAGMLVVVFSCFLSTLPYFIYGPATSLLKKTSLMKEKHEWCDLNPNGESCEDNEMSSTIPAVSILFIANFLNGFGSMSFFVVGIPYLDDNVQKKSSPIYLSAMSALRIFGPTLGFLLSSFTLRYYEDPFYDPGISKQDPRWVGAWWLGFLILGVAILICTIPMALFPKYLKEPSKSIEKDKEGNSQPSSGALKLKDIPKAVKKLIKNPILVCHTISLTFQINGILGYYVFMPKYMESQYRQSASSASLFSGSTSIVTMLIGILLGGIVIRKFKPRPRYLTGYMVFVEFVSIIGLISVVFLGCPSLEMPGAIKNPDGTLDIYNDCNEGCGCTRRVFEPTCGADGVSTYFSPCFAGCSNLNETFSSNSSLSTKKVFSNCTCSYKGNSTYSVEDMTSGYCSMGCNMFLPYIIVLSVSKMFSATARVGNALVTLRCVDDKDKSLALGLLDGVISLFGFIPYPLIFGALTDAACILWEEKCGRTGNCWLYDSDKFRYYLHGMAVLLIFIGTCFDFIVFLLSDRLKNFYDDEEDKDKDNNIASFKSLSKDQETSLEKYNNIGKNGVVNLAADFNSEFSKHTTKL